MEIKKSKNSHCRADNLKKRGKNVKEATKIIKQQAKTPKGSPKPMGRPREWTDEEIEAEANALNLWLENPNNYYFTKFLVERDLETSHLDKFAQYNENFRLALAKAKKLQEIRLVELAVSKKGDGGFIKFVLQNKAGWKEKSELSGDAANPLAIIMDKIAKKDDEPVNED